MPTNTGAQLKRFASASLECCFGSISRNLLISSASSFVMCDCRGRARRVVGGRSASVSAAGTGVGSRRRGLEGAVVSEYGVGAVGGGRWKNVTFPGNFCGVASSSGSLNFTGGVTKWRRPSICTGRAAPRSRPACIILGWLGSGLKNKGAPFRTHVPAIAWSRKFCNISGVELSCLIIFSPRNLSPCATPESSWNLQIPVNHRTSSYGIRLCIFSNSQHYCG